MQEVIKLRRVRTVTHYYITDTVALNPAEFYPLGAPQSEEAFLSWINAHLADLIANPDLSELTRLRLSKLDYYQEDRDRREDSLKMSTVGHSMDGETKKPSPPGKRKEGLRVSDKQ